MTKNFSLDEIRTALLLGGNVVVLMDGLNGHRLEWIRVFQARCNSIGRQCIILYPRSEKVEETHESFEHSKSKVCNDFQDRKEIIDYINSIQVHNWYFCWDSDNWIKEILISRHRISSLFLRPYLASLRPLSVLRYLIKIISILFLVSIRRSSVYLLRVPMHKSRFFRKRWVDDPHFDLLEFDSVLGIDMTRKKDSYNKKVVLVPGFISMRKNPSLIIEVCATVNDSIGEGLELMFAGKIQDDVLEVLDQHDFRWIGIKDDYLSRSEYLEQLQAADIVLLIYENIGSSGIVIDCLAYGIPVLILKNRFWKNLEKESEGLVKLTKKSSRKLAQDVEHMLSTNRTGNVFPCRYRSFRAMTGFDKMLQEIDN